jgi:hypothetical protein
MHSFMVLATAAALIVTGTAAIDAAPKKKTQASDPAAATAVKQKRGYVSKPAAGPSNRPSRTNQGWPTSVNDGSFSYGFGPGGSMR